MLFTLDDSFSSNKVNKLCLKFCCTMIQQKWQASVTPRFCWGDLLCIYLKGDIYKILVHLNHIVPMEDLLMSQSGMFQGMQHNFLRKMVFLGAFSTFPCVFCFQLNDMKEGQVAMISRALKAPTNELHQLIATAEQQFKGMWSVFLSCLPVFSLYLGHPNW